VISDCFNALLPRAIRTAIERPLRLDPMPDDLAAAMIADRREFVNRAFEAVEGVTRAGGDHLKRQIVVVAANLAFSHRR
jgi:hypothetical protein